MLCPEGEPGPNPAAWLQGGSPARAPATAPQGRGSHTTPHPAPSSSGSSVWPAGSSQMLGTHKAGPPSPATPAEAHPGGGTVLDPSHLTKLPF